MSWLQRQPITYEARYRIEDDYEAKTTGLNSNGAVTFSVVKREAAAVESGRVQYGADAGHERVEYTAETVSPPAYFERLLKRHAGTRYGYWCDDTRHVQLADSRPTIAVVGEHTLAKGTFDKDALNFSSHRFADQWLGIPWSSARLMFLDRQKWTYVVEGPFVTTADDDGIPNQATTDVLIKSVLTRTAQRAGESFFWRLSKSSGWLPAAITYRDEKHGSIARMHLSQWKAYAVEGYARGEVHIPLSIRVEYYGEGADPGQPAKSFSLDIDPATLHVGRWADARLLRSPETPPNLPTAHADANYADASAPRDAALLTEIVAARVHGRYLVGAVISIFVVVAATVHMLRRGRNAPGKRSVLTP